MAMAFNTLITDLNEFTIQSMRWCTAESEAEASKVYEILTAVTADATRRAKMSEETLEALKVISNRFALKSKPTKKSPIPPLVAALEQIKKDNVELGQIVDPIVEALQFQDRLRQNLDNISKLLTIWAAERESVVQQHATGSEALASFGPRFLQAMTSVEERDIIRKVIPGLPEETKTDDALFF